MSVTTHADMGKRLLVVKDTYANYVIPFFACDFDEIDVIDLRYTKTKVNKMLAWERYYDVLIICNIAWDAKDGNIYKMNQ